MNRKTRTDLPTDRQTDRHSDKHTERQTDKQADRQTDNRRESWNQNDDWRSGVQDKSPPDKSPPGQKPLLFSVGQKRWLDHGSLCTSVLMPSKQMEGKISRRRMERSGWMNGERIYTARQDQVLRRKETRRKTRGRKRRGRKSQENKHWGLQIRNQ